MDIHALSQLADQVLLRDLAVLVSQDRSTTAQMLAHIAASTAVDRSRLYAPAAHSSMFTYCVRELKMSEQMAYKRICAARAARRFPSILAAIEDGRLHLSAICALAPYLTGSNVSDLLAAAAYKSKRDLECMLAQRFPKPDVPTQVRPLAAASDTRSMLVIAGMQSHSPSSAGRESDALAMQLSPGIVAPMITAEMAQVTGPVVLGRGLETAHESQSASSSPMHPAPSSSLAATPARSYPRLTPLSPERFALQVTIQQETHDLMRRAQELLGAAVHANDLDAVLLLALRELVAKLEKRKHAATEQPRAQRQLQHGRTLPAAIRRAVRARDQDQCTFVADHDQRCQERSGLEYDHVMPVARGGRATVDNLRLRCRAHNQYEAERMFGAGFMRARIAESQARAGAL